MMERSLLDEAACAHVGAWRLPAAACGTPSTPCWDELARPSFCNSRPALLCPLLGLADAPYTCCTCPLQAPPLSRWTLLL